jgi:hypothetical protein
MRASKIDPETVDEIYSYNMGMHLGDTIYYQMGAIDADQKQELRALLREKVRSEGPPIASIVDEIGMTSPISRPVILDVDNGMVVEGRHRIAAALKYDLDLPFVMISSHRTKGWKRVP